jgi:copper(I)-binding protein
MPRIALPRRHLLLAISGAYMGLGVARPAQACEFFSSHMRIWHPWTRATRVDADTAQVFMRFDEVQQPDRLIGLETPLAGGARLAGPGAPDGATTLDLAIPTGQDLTLAENGLHIELLDLQQPLQIGRSYPLRLIFASAEPVNATLNVDFPSLR